MSSRLALVLSVLLCSGCTEELAASDVDFWPGDAGQDRFAGESALRDARPADQPGKASCSPGHPQGECPAGRICRDGACIVDLDPQEPVSGDPLGRLDALWSFFDTSYGAFPAKPQLDWSKVKTDYSAQVGKASTSFQVAWLLTRMVGELFDGHTYAQDKQSCTLTSPYGQPWSNVGACLVEASGKLFVYRVGAGAGGFQRGDELLSIDGRGVDALLRDAEQQPRCTVSASTGAMRRAQLIAGLLMRAPNDRKVTVRRGEQQLTLTVTPVADPASYLSCDGRIGPGPSTVQGLGVESTSLAGNVTYIRLPLFGAYQGGAFVAQPVIDILRKLFQGAGASAGVVLDLRANPGGSPQVYMALASWLYAKSTTLFYCQSKTGPGHADHGAKWPMASTPDPALHYAGPLAVLADARTMSCGDFSTAFLHLTGRAKTFGHPSGGGFGNGIFKQLDAEWSVGVNDVLCSDTAGSYLEGAPPPVDFPVEYLPADILAGKDTVIEAARAWVAKQASP